MTEEEWSDCANPVGMLTELGERICDGLFRKFSVACCRRVWHLMVDERSRRAVEVAERYADGQETADELAAARCDAHQAQSDAYRGMLSAEAAAGFCDSADYSAAWSRLHAACAARAAVSLAVADPDGGWECYHFNAAAPEPVWFGRVRLDNHTCAAQAVASAAHSAAYAAAPRCPDDADRARTSALATESAAQAEVLRALAEGLPSIVVG